MNMNRRNRSMKLKTKVIISFFITIFVPIILCGITFYLFSEYKVKAIGEQYGIENPTYEMLSNNALMLDILTSREYTELSGKVENHPRELENTSYLEKINAKLLKDSSFLAVRKDDEIFFNGSDRVEDHELLETLPAYGNTGIEENGGIYLHSDQKELVKQLDFTFEDGSDGSVFIVTKVDEKNVGGNVFCDRFDSGLYELCPELLDLPGCDFPVGTVEKSDAEYQGRQPGFHGRGKQCQRDQ